MQIIFTCCEFYRLSEMHINNINLILDFVILKTKNVTQI